MHFTECKLHLKKSRRKSNRYFKPTVLTTQLLLLKNEKLN